MHDAQFSQAPLLLLPESAANKIDPSKLQIAPARIFKDEQIKEFRKTADAIAKPPWNLVKGQQYLTKLCDAQDQGWGVEPEPLHFIFEYSMPDLKNPDTNVPPHMKNTIQEGAKVAVPREVR
eukprot:1642094-Pyramimonas_sp.AAC.1